MPCQPLCSLQPLCLRCLGAARRVQLQLWSSTRRCGSSAALGMQWANPRPAVVQHAHAMHVHYTSAAGLTSPPAAPALPAPQHLMLRVLLSGAPEGLSHTDATQGLAFLGLLFNATAVARLLCLSLGEAFCADDTPGQAAAAELLRDASRWAADDKLQVRGDRLRGWRSWCLPGAARHLHAHHVRHIIHNRPAAACCAQALAAELAGEALASTEDEVPMPAAG